LAQLIITYWRDIPAQVTAKEGRTAAKREMSLRFTEAIDMAAMRSGAAGTDDYLAEWRRGTPQSCGPDLEAEVSAALAKIEAEYDKERLVALAKNGGRETA
jgi:Virulence factor